MALSGSVGLGKNLRKKVGIKGGDDEALRFIKVIGNNSDSVLYSIMPFGSGPHSR